VRALSGRRANVDSVFWCSDGMGVFYQAQQTHWDLAQFFTIVLAGAGAHEQEIEIIIKKTHIDKKVLGRLKVVSRLGCWRTKMDVVTSGFHFRESTSKRRQSNAAALTYPVEIIILEPELGKVEMR
jgi:hypothetical protein